MSATLILAVPFYAGGIVLASLSRLALIYPSIGDLDRRFARPEQVLVCLLP